MVLIEASVDSSDFLNRDSQRAPGRQIILGGIAFTLRFLQRFCQIRGALGLVRGFLHRRVPFGHRGDQQGVCAFQRRLGVLGQLRELRVLRRFLVPVGMKIIPLLQRVVVILSFTCTKFKTPAASPPIIRQ